MAKGVCGGRPVWFAVTCEAWSYDLSEGSFDFDEALSLMDKFESTDPDSDWQVSCWTLNSDQLSDYCCGTYRFSGGWQGVKEFEFCHD